MLEEIIVSFQYEQSHRGIWWHFCWFHATKNQGVFCTIFEILVSRYQLSEERGASVCSSLWQSHLERPHSKHVHFRDVKLFYMNMRTIVIWIYGQWRLCFEHGDHAVWVSWCGEMRRYSGDLKREGRDSVGDCGSSMEDYVTKRSARENGVHKE